MLRRGPFCRLLYPQALEQSPACGGRSTHVKEWVNPHSQKGQERNPQVAIISMSLFSEKELKRSNKGLEKLKDLILQTELSFLEEVTRLGFNCLG